MALLQIISTVLAVLVGYVLGVVHTKRAMYDAIDQLRRDRSLRKGDENR